MTPPCWPHPSQDGVQQHLIYFFNATIFYEPLVHHHRLLSHASKAF